MLCENKAGAAAAAAGAPLTPQKRELEGGHVAGSASKAPKGDDYYKSVDERQGFKVGDRVQIVDVFAPYKSGMSLIGDYAHVRAIGWGAIRTILLVEMENKDKTAFVRAVNRRENGPPKSNFPYVTWSSTEHQADHLLAVRPGQVVLA
jgi:hypothetical protein